MEALSSSRARSSLVWRDELSLLEYAIMSSRSAWRAVFVELIALPIDDGADK